MNNAVGTYRVNIAQEYGLNAAVLLEEIFRRIDIAEANKDLDEEGYLAITAEQLYEWTSLTRRQQVKVTEVLEKNGFIDCKLKGIPAKKHFKILKLEGLV